MSISPSTIRRYKREFDSYLANISIFNKPINTIDTPELLIALKDMIVEHKMQKKKASNIVGYVTGAFNYAITKRYIKENPVIALDRKLLFSMCESSTVYQDNERVLTISEIEALSKAIDKHLSKHPTYIPDYAIKLALLTGMRVGELSALKWEDIDLENRVIRIRRSEHRDDYLDGTSKLEIGLPKNGKIRVFPINESILELLNDVKKVHSTTPFDFIFIKPDGNRATGHDIGCAAARRASEAGIGSTSIHEIRRTVSSLLNTKLPRKAVADMLGHSERVNETHYDYSIAENTEKIKALDLIHNEVSKGIQNIKENKNKKSTGKP